ncbi:MAG: hypothetical protein QM784_32745 [Polyangiaceae bacterium]
MAVDRKGFPESYDRHRLVQFVMDVKSGAPEVTAPVYSHLVYDIVPGEAITVSQPDILIVEELNVLQPARRRTDGTTGLAVSDFFDFSVYVDAAHSDIRNWYVNRFLNLRETAFPGPAVVFRPLRADVGGGRRRRGRRRLEPDQRPEPGAEHPPDPGQGHRDPPQGRGPPGRLGAGSGRCDGRAAGR